MPDDPHDPPPRLRPLGVHGLDPSGTGPVRLVDPLGLAGGASAAGRELDGEAWAVLRRLDGSRSLAEIAEAAGGELGRAVGPDQVAALVAGASRSLLLEDTRFERAREQAFDAFRREQTRAAVGPGRDYEADGFELRIRIGGLVADEWDLPPLHHAQGLWSPSAPLGLGGPLYSRAFASVRHCRGRVARVLLLGNVGAPLGSLLVPLAKPFETPLGTVAVDGEGLAALGHLPGRDQLAHRQSLELERQLLFVRLLFPETPIVPVLVSAPSRSAGTLEAWETREVDDVERAVEGLAAVLALEGPTLVIAGADCYRRGQAPMGAASGAPRGALLGGGAGHRIQDTDREAIDAAARLAADEFIAIAFDDPDPSRAGLAAAPYLMLRVLEGRASALDASELRGSTLGYMSMPGAGQLSTATAMVFH